MTVEDLKKWADRCEREGRTSQAILVRNMAWEAEHGAPWLQLIAEEDARIAKRTAEALRQEIALEQAEADIELLTEFSRKGLPS